jgi:hypothetical protein
VQEVRWRPGDARASSEVARMMRRPRGSQAAVAEQKPPFVFPKVPKRCPFCGLTPDLDDVDFLHPENRVRTVWGAHCSGAAGGCDASTLGDSREDAMRRWEERAFDTPAPPGISAAYRRDIERAVLELRHLSAGEPSRSADALEAMLAEAPVALGAPA